MSSLKRQYTMITTGHDFDSEEKNCINALLNLRTDVKKKHISININTDNGTITLSDDSLSDDSPSPKRQKSCLVAGTNYGITAHQSSSGDISSVITTINSASPAPYKPFDNLRNYCTNFNIQRSDVHTGCFLEHFLTLLVTTNKKLLDKLDLLDAKCIENLYAYACFTANYRLIWILHERYTFIKCTSVAFTRLYNNGFFTACRVIQKHNPYVKLVSEYVTNTVTPITLCEQEAKFMYFFGLVNSVITDLICKLAPQKIKMMKPFGLLTETPHIRKSVELLFSCAMNYTSTSAYINKCLTFYFQKHLSVRNEFSFP
jgi:hypothetical protein